MKRLIALLLALALICSLSACAKDGGEKTNASDTQGTKVPASAAATSEAKTEAATTEAPGPELTVHENTFFTVSYNEADGWSLAKDDARVNETGGGADLRILDEAGKTKILVSIRAEQTNPYGFRKDMAVRGVDLRAYAAGEVETVDIGGQPMLYLDKSDGGRIYYGRNEAAGVTYSITAGAWNDPRVPALVDTIVCSASAADYTEPAWPWDGEPIALGHMSQMVGTCTVTADFIPMSEALTTFEVFNHEVEVIGDKLYLLSDFVLREYSFDGSSLTFLREIPLEEQYKRVENSKGTMVLSNFMKPVIGHDGTSVVFSYDDGPDYFSLAPDGAWGISWFSSGETTEKYSFKDGALVGEPFPFHEVKNISTVDVDASYIYVVGSPAEGNGHSVFVYDHSGTLKMQLKGDPNGTIGLGSITAVAKTSGGFLAFDGNLRRLVLWTADGTWLGHVNDEDIFGTYYPWFATADVLEDGSILVVMTEDRVDGSAKEVIAFKVTVS